MTRTIGDAQVRQAVQTAFGRLLGPAAITATVSMVVAVIFAVPRAISGATNWLSVAVAVIIGGLSAVTWRLLRTPRGDWLRAHPGTVAQALALAVVITPVQYMLVHREFTNNIGMALLMVCIGALILDRRAVATALVLCNLVWTGVGLELGMSGQATTFVSGLVMVNVVAFGLNWINVRTVWDLERSRAQVDLLADADELTGLSNRLYLRREGRHLIERASRDGGALTLIVVDVDNLKTVNDTHGHRAGDAVLREVADALTAATRPEDLVARWGGDEFVVLAAGATSEGREALVDRLVRTVADAGHGVSAGSVVLTPHELTGADPDAVLDDLFARADAAMYSNKVARASRPRTNP